MDRLFFDVLQILTAVVSVMAVAAHGGSPQSPATGRDAAADLSGVWKLNQGLTDDPSKVMRASGGHGPGMHGGGAGREGMDAQQIRARRQLLEAPSRLTITQTDNSVTFTESDGRVQTLTTDNTPQRLQLGTQTVDVKSRWDGGRLVKEMSLGDGLTLTETYSVSVEPRQLHVTVKLDGAHLPQPINFRRVYDAERPR
jgi:hypothetical protein